MSVINQMLQDLDQRPRMEASVQEALSNLKKPQIHSKHTRLSYRVLILALLALALSYLATAIWKKDGERINAWLQTEVQTEAGLYATARHSPQSLVEIREELAPQTISAAAPAAIPKTSDILLDERKALFEPNVLGPTPATVTEVAAKVISQSEAIPEETPNLVATTTEIGSANLQRVRFGVDGMRTRLVIEFANENREPIRRIEESDGGLTLWFDNATLKAAAPSIPFHDRLLKEARMIQQGEHVALRLIPKDKPIYIRYHQRQEETMYPHWLVIDVRPQELVLVTENKEQAPKPIAQTSVVMTSLEKPEHSNLANNVLVTTKVDGIVNRTPALLNKEEKLVAAYSEAMDALRDQQIVLAQQKLTEVLNLEPSHPHAREQLARLLLQLKQTEQAYEVVQKGLALKPDYPPLASLAARILIDQNQHQEAAMYLEGAAVNAKTDADYQILMAAVYQHLGEHKLAVNSYLQALSVNPQKAVWWMGLGISLHAQAQEQEALGAFLEARKLGLNKELLAYVDGQIIALDKPNQKSTPKITR